ncbi:MAG: 3-oxoacyl-[Lachnospiraceae bacterium]|nr:3-oxoacyl-[acyl-carrier-protein] reductase [Lachnospiraceae bacterium]
MEKMERPVALITGASGGIGSAMANIFAKNGYSLALHCHSNKERLNELVNALLPLLQDGQTIITVSGDLSSEEDVNRVLEEVTSKLAGIDVLINNAGITKDKLLMSMKTEDFDSVISSNLRSVYLTCHGVIRTMLKRRSGRIINISSVVGVNGNPGQANYAASKAGIIGFSKSLAKEVASRGITVNCIAPGMIETKMTEVLTDKAKEAILSRIPMGRMGQPEEVAQAALFLASDAANYITAAVIPVDGGM